MLVLNEPLGHHSSQREGFQCGCRDDLPWSSSSVSVPAFPWFLMLTQLFFPDVGAGQAAREPCGGEASLLQSQADHEGTQLFCRGSQATHVQN